MTKEEARKMIENAQRRQREFDAERSKFDQKSDELLRRQLAEKGVQMRSSSENKNTSFKDYDSVYGLGNGLATVLYVAVMIGGLIFKDWWLIWVVATFVWSKYITRS